MKIDEQISKVISNSEKSYIETPRGKHQKPLKYNQREIISKINLYLNDQYVERDDNALFWNIGTPRLTHFTKLISPDTKDFYPYGLGELNFWQAWALRKNVTKWFKDNSFYKTLNDIAEGLATYGSSVWKRCEVDGYTEIEEVNLENLYFDQSVACINDTDIVEKHYLDRADLWEKWDVWENISELLEKDSGAIEKFEIDEFWGYVDEDDTHEYKHVIKYGTGNDYKELFTENVKKEDCPYSDFHLGRFRGRWMRVGVIERLFKLQARTNELVNQNAAYTAIASLLLLKSENPDATGNVLEQAENGQILGDATLQQVGITNLQFNQFISEMQLISQQADRLCLTPDIIQGEASPSNTTFRGLAVVNAGAVTAFKNYRQDFFEKISEILMDYIFPALVKDWKHKDVLNLAEDDGDIEEYGKSLQRVMEKDALLSGIVVDEEVKTNILNSIEENLKATPKSLKLTKDFWNFDFGFKMMASDDSVDKPAKNDAYFNALNMTGANPMLTTIPGFKQYLEDNNIKPWALTAKQVEQMQQAQVGGANQLPEQKKPDKLLAEAKQLT